jgi:hypothetical protein
MTTDTKAVARWTPTDRGSMKGVHWGDYILFSDHEQVVAELEQKVVDSAYSAVLLQRAVDQLRTALAAKSAEVDGLAKTFSEVNIEECLRAFNDVLTPALRVPYTMAFRIAMTAAISVAMEKSND